MPPPDIQVAALCGAWKGDFSVAEYLIAGLGNPGKEYEKTRHNVGFVALDYLAEKMNVKMTKLKFKAIMGEGVIGGKKCILLKPQTYMNSSGESIRDAAAFYKIPPENIIVIYDDVALEPGKVRIRPSGSAGGHNGMKSIIYLLNSDEFPRIRFGVGAPSHDMVNHVLGHFSEEDGVSVTRAIKKIDEILETALTRGISEAMSRYNNREL